MGIILSAYEVMRGISRAKPFWLTIKVDSRTRFALSSRDRAIKENHEHNLKAAESYRMSFQRNGGFIENQSELKNLRFGLCSLDYCGCGIIAACNALNALDSEGEDTGLRLAGLIREFEEDGAAFAGQFGLSPKAIYDHMRMRFGDRAAFRGDAGRLNKTARLDELFGPGSVFIITIMNDRNNILKMLHTMCVTREGDGRLRAHNSGIRSSFADAAEMMYALGEGRGRAGLLGLITLSA